jgi:hypothetical protein
MSCWWNTFVEVLASRGVFIFQALTRAETELDFGH